MLATPITPLIDEKNLRLVRDLILQSSNILITTHVSPDGDALGSSLGLYHHLLKRGKKVRVMVPNSFPYFLKWMKGSEDVLIFEYNPEAGKHIIDEVDLIFCLDYNIPKRIGKMATHVQNAHAKRILIDHHPYPEKACEVVISHPEKSSTSELIFRLIDQLGEYESMNHATAECIYCGMMTDTGGFTYNSNDPEIFEIISLLLKKKIDKDAIYSNVYNNYSKDRFLLLGFTLLHRMKIYDELHSALIYLSKEDQNQFKYNKGDTEGFVNYPLSIKDIVFSTFIREDEDYIKISFRSQGNFACNEFASEFFNGGGHRNASGGEYYGTMKEVLEIFENGLQQYAQKLQSSKR